MGSQSRSRWTRVLGGTIVVAIVVGALWALAPEEARGLLLLAAGAITVAIYLGLYAIERRRHWDS